MIFEIAAGIVLGLFAFIVIYRYWRVLLWVILAVILIGVLVVVAAIVANDPNSQFARTVIIMSLFFIVGVPLSVIATVIDQTQKAGKLPQWLYRTKDPQP